MGGAACVVTAESCYAVLFGSGDHDGDVSYEVMMWLSSLPCEEVVMVMIVRTVAEQVNICKEGSEPVYGSVRE